MSGRAESRCREWIWPKMSAPSGSGRTSSRHQELTGVSLKGRGWAHLPALDPQDPATLGGLSLHRQQAWCACCAGGCACHPAR